MSLHRFGPRLVVVVVVAVVCAAILEGGARLAGYRPWPSHERLIGISKRLHQVDDTLGWRKLIGEFRVQRFGRELTVTHWSANRRATAATDLSRDGRVLVIGGSFAYGLGLFDDETLPWLMQRPYTETEWLNLATSGYGTLQALLTLEEYLSQNPTSPRLVIYGYNWFHAERNVAADSWQYAMAVSSPGIRLPLPFVSVDVDGGLRRSVHLYPDWPGKRFSAAIALMERAWNKLQVRGRAGQAEPATRLLLQEMQELTRSRGSRLLVMVMGRCDECDFFRRESIDYVDCMPDTYSPEMSLPDSHPSGLRNELYAECLRAWVDRNEESFDNRPQETFDPPVS